MVASVTPRLAVITVTFSPGKHLEALIDSIGKATSRDTIVVCADNGSIDGSPQRAAESHEHVEFFPTGGNLGYGTAINRAYEWLSGPDFAGRIDAEWILVVNPDVEFGPGSIDTLVDAGRRCPRGGVFGPRIVEGDGSTYPSARAVPRLRTGIGHAIFGTVWPANPWSRDYRQGEEMDHERLAGWLSGSCLLIRREAFESVGGFDERYFMYFEDTDLGDRLHRAGWDNVYVPGAVINHDQGHAANAVPEKMLPAHHESAYRFQADRHRGPFLAPLRWTLWLGLRLRQRVALRAAQRAPK